MFGQGPMDDPSIDDDELLLRGLLKEWFADGVVSSAAFKPSIKNGPHISVYREAICDPQQILAKVLRLSKAFGRLVAEAPRGLKPEVVGVGQDDEDDDDAHVLIIRNLDVPVDSDTWAVAAFLLAEACAVVHHRQQ